MANTNFTHSFSTLATLLVLLVSRAVAQPAVPADQPALDLKSAARKSFAQGELAQAHQHLSALLDHYRAASAEDDYNWLDRLSEVAHEYLRSGDLDHATKLLGEAADLSLPFDERRGVGSGSAAGGWHRHLAQLDADERYELLFEWSMPTEARRSLRVLTAMTPIDTPPTVFARALGERPRDTSFAIAEVGGVRGLFCSTWELVRAADDSGNLRRLTTELTRLADEDVPNAQLALTLARIKGARRVDDELRHDLAAHAASLTDRSTTSPFATLPQSQRVWQFGYGDFHEKAGRTINYKPLPRWDGRYWQGGATYPGPILGWARLKPEGGHPGAEHPVIRRWVAPAAGTLTIRGALQRPSTAGNGIRGRIISSRAGLIKEWIVPSGTQLAAADPIDVASGETIDFMVDAYEKNGAVDSFLWSTKLSLETTGGQSLTFDSERGFHGPARSNADVVVGAACLTHDWLQEVGEDILKTKLEQTYGPESLRLRPFLRYAHAMAIRARFPDADDELLVKPGLQLWVPSSSKRAWPSPQGTVRPLWLSDSNHVMHTFGPRNDHLFFKYPVIGDFEFSCETQIGRTGNSDGGVAYGGRSFEVWAARNLAKIWDSSFYKLTEFHCPFVRANQVPTFNRFTVTSTSEAVTLSTNGHPIWTDSSVDRTSPWIGLRSFGERVPFFRNLQLVGVPVVPREVKMTAGSSLHGWVADYYGESTPTLVPQQAGLKGFLSRITTSYDWSAVGGEIRGAKQTATSDATRQSRLYYFRPLQDGESVSYEFVYQPGEVAVHPTLGRIAFLIEPGGVRLHWMTDGDHEWTGLAEDNAVVEPLSRRGPKPLPLVTDDWNRVTVELKRDKLTLTLNDAKIYERKLESDGERTFGFYHDKGKSVARIRNVVLRGDWPEQLSAEVTDHLAAVANPERSKVDRRMLGAIFADQHIHGSVLSIHQQATQLPADERYAFLSQWVLPNTDHHTLRLALDFSPTNPPPIDLTLPLGGSRGTSGEGSQRPAEADDLNSTTQPSPRLGSTLPEGGLARITIGGDLVSPAMDLVEAASELDKIAELRQRVAAIAVGNDAQQRRSQLAMLALIDIEAGESNKAKVALDELATMVTATESMSLHERWPETLAIWSAAQHTDTRDTIRDLAYRLLVDQVRKQRTSGSEAWDQFMTAIISRIDYLDLQEREPEVRARADRTRNGQSPLANWVATSRETARSRGQGFPPSQWAVTESATVKNIVSHHDDYLFYRIPLRGDFEVECDMTGFGYQETNIWLAGRWTAPVYTFRHVDVGDFRETPRHALDPPIHKPDPWIHYRAVVRDGVCTSYANGHKIHQRRLTSEYNPWLAIRSHFKTNGSIRNLRITGDPEIPDEVRITADPDLPGWLPINEGHRVGRGQKWHQLGELDEGGGIRGQLWDQLPGSHWETLIRYQRPMVEDGTINYDFYYREGEVHVHPALDRLAFMLLPEGVSVHWVGDEQFDRTGLPPDNLFTEADNRRGPETLPLEPDAWNQLQLSLAGDTVSLTLNETLVYERQLEPTNQRTFGLFHYADRTEALVRNVRWRGDWPRELPSLAEQELAGENMDFLDEGLDQLTEVFEHDFTTDGLAERFGMLVGQSTHFQQRSDGLHVTRPGGNGYNDSAIVPHLKIGGDFDIVAEFNGFVPQQSEGGSSGVFLQAILDSEKSNEFLVYRRQLWHRAEPQPIVQASFVTREVGGARRSRFTNQVVEAPAGRLRLARRGDTVYYLFAENDSPHFRLFGTTESAPTEDIKLLKLMAQTHLEGQTDATWKTLTVRANKLSGLALQDQQAVLAKLNKQRDELPDRFSHDFASDPIDESRFQAWGPFQPVANRGTQLTSIGANRWTSSGFNSRIGLQGDFDVSLTFDDLKLAKPSAGKNSALYLQIEFPDTAKTQVNVIIVDHIDGERQMYAQIRVVDEEGNYEYRRIRTSPVRDVEKLRLARRGKQFSFLYRTKGASSDHILAQHDVFASPILPYNVRWLLHTGGDRRQSTVLLKQFDVRAATISSNPSQPPASLRALSAQLTGDVPKHALDFDGRTQYVTIPSMRYDGSHPITLEAFVTPDALGGVVVGDTQQSGIGLQVRREKYNIHAWNGTGYDTAGSDTPPPRFVRVHLAGTFDGEQLQLFVDGKLAGTRDMKGPFTGSPLPMTIGSSPSPNQGGIDVAFDGLIDQVRISKTVRYRQNFAVPKDLAADDSTLALFRCDEGKGTKLTDSSGNDHHGEIRGAVWVTGDAVRLRAAEGLAQYGKFGVTELVDALDSQSREAQLHAIAALGRIGPDARDALPALKKLSEHSDAAIRAAASQAVSQIEANGIIRSILNLFGR